MREVIVISFSTCFCVERIVPMKLFYAFISYSFLTVGIGITLGEANIAQADSLIDTSQLERYGLTRPWFTQVEMDRGRDQVESVFFDGELITVQTKRGVIQAIDGETGETVWVTHAGSPQLFTSPIGVGPQHVAVVNGSHLFIFDRSNGKQIWKRQLKGGVIGGPGLSKEYVFVPKVDGTLEAYSLSKPRDWKNVRSIKDTQFSIWHYNSHGKTMVQPVVLNQTIAWANDRAQFYVAKLNPLQILFRVEAFDNIVAPPAYIEGHLYLASVDGYLHKVHGTSGDIRWRFSTGETLVNRPVAMDGFVYLTTTNGGLYRVLADEDVAKDRGAAKKEESGRAPMKEGKEVWFAPNISQVLAVHSDKLFGMDRKGNLRIVDNESGKVLGTIPTHGISIPLTNHINDRVYLVTSNGLVQCIRDINAVSPIIHDEKGKKAITKNDGENEDPNDLE